MQYPGVNLEINDPNFDLKKAPETDKLGFIRKVYGILSSQLLLTVIFCGIVMSNETLTEFVQNDIAVFVISIIVAIALMLVLIFSKDKARKVPTNYILLIIFTLCESYMVSTAYTFYDAYTVIAAALMTLGVTLVLTVYAFLTKKEFRHPVGVSLSFISSIILLMIFAFYNVGNHYSVIWCFVGVNFYGIYIIYDTQLIVNGSKYGITTDDYVVGAMILYIDIIGLFLKIMALIGKVKK
ncbi:unnamed protein product [Blepharisma stoltei]|uniref:Uncharacterized protein n=1 Tax=Blepharisma stoltei TaxID=1481888 RepID=A0AAU9INQ4_9CILI|nr:unnamed protein product [Blepharisma stoltei]